MRHTPEKTTGDLAPAGAFKAHLECLKAPSSVPLLPHLLSQGSHPKSFAGMSSDTTFLLVAQKKGRDLMDSTLCLMS